MSAHSIECRCLLPRDDASSIYALPLWWGSTCGRVRAVARSTEATADASAPLVGVSGHCVAAHICREAAREASRQCSEWMRTCSVSGASLSWAATRCAQLCLRLSSMLDISVSVADVLQHPTAASISSVKSGSFRCTCPSSVDSARLVSAHTVLEPVPAAHRARSRRATAASRSTSTGFLAHWHDCTCPRGSHRAPRCATHDIWHGHRWILCARVHVNAGYRRHPSPPRGICAQQHAAEGAATRGIAWLPVAQSCGAYYDAQSSGRVLVEGHCAGALHSICCFSTHHVAVDRHRCRFAR